METIQSLIQYLNPILGWTSLVFYIMIVVFSNMQTMRKWAYASIINDILYGISMGAHGFAKVTINLAVGAINSNRYLKDFTNTSRSIRISVAQLAILGVAVIVYFGATSLYNDFSIAGLLLWVDAALVIGSLTVQNIRKYQALMMFACPPAIAGYYMIGEIPMVIIKVIVFCIAAYKLMWSVKNEAN